MHQHTEEHDIYTYGTENSTLYPVTPGSPFFPGFPCKDKKRSFTNGLFHDLLKCSTPRFSPALQSVQIQFTYLVKLSIVPSIR